MADIAGGTATATIQIQATQTFKSWCVSAMNVATGKYELSMSSSSQIGTAQPDSNVFADFPIRVPVKAFQNIYVHCTGSGNLGTSVLS